MQDPEAALAEQLLQTAVPSRKASRFLCFIIRWALVVLVGLKLSTSGSWHRSAARELAVALRSQPVSTRGTSDHGRLPGWGAWANSDGEEGGRAFKPKPYPGENDCTTDGKSNTDGFRTSSEGTGHDVETMAVSELRKVIENCGLSHFGLIEKSELVERARAAMSAQRSRARTNKRPREDKSFENLSAKRHYAPRKATVPPRSGPLASNFKDVREALPIWKYRSRILEAIQKHQVVIVEGKSGCGKTTQVGQFILEEAAKMQSPCSIIFVQPRRIRAVGVADRVAIERGEKLGDTVGYSVRQDRQFGRTTQLLFCTAHVLLRRLDADGSLDSITHIILDEVHERSADMDFLLLALRDLARRRLQLKIVLMSATMDKDLVGLYFGGVPSIGIPGKGFPVTQLYLEDVLNHFWISQPTEFESRLLSHVSTYEGKPTRSGGDSTLQEEQIAARKHEELWPRNVRQRYRDYEPQVQAFLEDMNQDAVYYGLLLALLEGSALQELARINGERDKRPTGVLVFLPGEREIRILKQKLLDTVEFSDEPARSWVLPLYDDLALDEQRKVFNRPPPGIRKIILSTEVAETSIMIDDIGYVVDTCRMKEMQYDAARRISRVEDIVITRANAKQRRERAGGAAPGVAVHVGLTKFRHYERIDHRQTPEIQRLTLEQLVLRIPRLLMRSYDGNSKRVCAELLEAPNPLSVEKAVNALVRLGAITLDDGTSRETLTVLGQNLAKLPVEPRFGKLVLLGVVLGPAATDAALTVASVLASHNPFSSALNWTEAFQAKRDFASEMVEGPIGLSDHMAVFAAYRRWDQLSHFGSDRETFCTANFLSNKKMHDISHMKRLLLEVLSEAGFAREGILLHDVEQLGLNHGSDGVLQALGAGLSTWKCPPKLFAALLCVALSPQVAIVFKEKSRQKPYLMIMDESSQRQRTVSLGSGSVWAVERKLRSPYLVYQAHMSKSNLEPSITGVTPVTQTALALFGGRLVAHPNRAWKSHAELVVDDWITISVQRDVSELVFQMRQRLDDVFADWVEERRQSRVPPNVLARQDGGDLLESVLQLLGRHERNVHARVVGKRRR